MLFKDTRELSSEDKHQFKFNLDKFYPINPIENLDEMSFLGGRPEYLQQESDDF